MPPPSKLSSLPEDVLAQLDERLRISDFGGFVDHERWLRELGYEVGKSAIHSYAQRNRVRIKLRAGTASLADSTSAVKAADQRIECLKVAASLYPADKVMAEAEKFYLWAYRR